MEKNQQVFQLQALLIACYTHIVLDEVWVILLNAVVEDGDDDPFPCEALLPGTLCIQVVMVWIVLLE